MKKILIITYYWIPSGGAGVQRWVKFAKYLREYACEPIIYAPENPEYPSRDDSFGKDIPLDMQIIKKPLWEPYNLYRKIFNKRGEVIPAGFITENKKAGWKEKLSIWIRGNFFIPDPRKYWIKPSVKFLKHFIQEQNIDVIITTGPPHSMHLIGLALKKSFPTLPWIADFRDPWTNIDFYKDLNLTTWADAKHHSLERKVIGSADVVTVVSEGMRKEFEQKHPKQIKVIPNGFDHQDVKNEMQVLDSCFTISHIGTMNAARNPVVLWSALKELCDENKIKKSDLKIQLIGQIDFSVLESVEKFGLTDCLEKTAYLTHDKAIQKQQTSQVLLLIINRTANANAILTGKFFEYLAANRPLIGVGPVDGDAAAVLKQTKAGKIIDYEDVEGMKELVFSYYKLYKENALTLKTSSVESFSRKNLTKELSHLIHQLTSHA